VLFQYCTNPSFLSSDSVNGGPSDIYPVWSPDGQRIAFVSDRDNGDQIYVMNVDGSHVQEITNLRMDRRTITSPVWAPDSSSIEFALTYVNAENGFSNSNIYVVNISSLEAQQLTHEIWDTDPARLPDGQHVIDRAQPNERSEIWVINGNKQKRLTNNNVD